MHSAWVRWNVVIMHSMMFAAFIVLATQLTNQYAHGPAVFTPAKAEFGDIQVARLKAGPGGRDKLVLMFETELDLGSLFDWNTKQVFAFVTVSYPTEFGLNEIVAWDKIFHTREEAQVKGKLLTKYELEDVGKGFYGNGNITMNLCWDVMPFVGLVGKHTQLNAHPPSSKQFPIPARYGSFLIQ